jgi:hypothetical protein
MGMITQNNILIAEFMGFKKDSPSTNWYYDLKKSRYYRLNELLYDTDWNWLMSVVDKIESIVWEEINDTSFNVTIGATYYCVIQDNNGGMLEIIEQGKSKLESVYNAVVKFITWYNETKIK